MKLATKEKKKELVIKDKKNLQMIKKALAVSVDQGDSDVSSYLPAPLAMQVIAYIRDITLMRRLVRVFTQSARNWKKPKRSSGMSAYYIPDGVQAVETGFTATSVTWVAKKLMSYVVVDEESIEDSQPDLIQQVLEDFAKAVAEAEDYAFLQGDPTHLATAPDPSSATSNNWFARDPRLAFQGIFTAAASGSAATQVDAGATSFDTDMVNKALYNLGKYGRNKANIKGIAPVEQAANIRGNSELRSALTSGLPLASFITGLGSAGEGEGLITRIFGVDLYEGPFAPAGQIALFHKDSPSIGDRRLIKFVSDVVIEQDQRKYVVSERISFNFDYTDALALITNLSQTLVS
jgi:hypothetical protein